jgi:hypothetical protein
MTQGQPCKGFDADVQYVSANGQPLAKLLWNMKNQMGLDDKDLCGIFLLRPPMYDNAHSYATMRLQLETVFRPHDVELEKLELPNCHPHLGHIQDVFRQNQLLRLFPSAFPGMLFAMHLKHAQFVFCFLLYIVGYFLTCKGKEIV